MKLAKKYFLIFCAVLITITILLLILFEFKGEKNKTNLPVKENSENYNKAFIEKEIYEMLKEKESVMVIVDLQDSDIGYSDIETSKARVKAREEQVLPLLEGEFELRYLFEMTPGFAGRITKEGLAILETNELVKAVYAEKILHTTT